MKLSSKDSSSAYEYMLYGGIWLLVLMFPVTHEAMQVSSEHSFVWRPVFEAWMGMLPFMVAFVIHNFWAVKYFLNRGHIIWYLLFVLVLTICFSLFQMEISGLHAPEMPPHGFGAHGPGPGSEPNPGPIGHPHPQPRPFFPDWPPPVLTRILLLVLMFGINLAINLLFQNQKEKRKREELENIHTRNELKYLKTQLNPHFFMNLLNNIHGMIELDPAEAQEMVIKMSKLMRYTLYDGEKQMAKFKDEVDFLKIYLSLMEQRYSKSKVEISTDIPDNPSEDVMVPPLIFASFIENSFKHGISYQNRSFVNISLRESDTGLVFTCENSIFLSSANTEEGGIGLKNVVTRLDLLYGESYSLRNELTDNKYRVVLVLPKEIRQ